MKIRASYVSNSSSSSFVVFGQEISDPVQKFKDGFRVYCIAEGAGTSGDAADIIVPIDASNAALFVGRRYLRGVRVRYIAESKESLMLSGSSVEPSFKLINSAIGKLYCFEQDYSSPKSLEDLKNIL